MTELHTETDSLDKVEVPADRLAGPRTPALVTALQHRPGFRARRRCPASSWSAAVRPGWSSSPVSASAWGGSRASVTLVEGARAHLWKPLLHSVAAGSIDPGEYEVDYLAQAHWHGFHYRFGKMIGLDRARKEVHLAATVDEEGRQITPAGSVSYDILVIAIGSMTNDFGTPGVAEYAVPLETPAQAERFNRRLVNAFLRAQTQQGPVRPGQLHVAIVGAGATGTELAAELRRSMREVVGYGLDRIDPERDIRIALIEARSGADPPRPARTHLQQSAASARQDRCRGPHPRKSDGGNGGRPQPRRRLLYRRGTGGVGGGCQSPRGVATA